MASPASSTERMWSACARLWPATSQPVPERVAASRNRVVPTVAVVGPLCDHALFARVGVSAERATGLPLAPTRHSRTGASSRSAVLRLSRMRRRRWRRVGAAARSGCRLPRTMCWYTIMSRTPTTTT